MPTGTPDFDEDEAALAIGERKFKLCTKFLSELKSSC